MQLFPQLLICLESDRNTGNKRNLSVKARSLMPGNIAEKNLDNQQC